MQEMDSEDSQDGNADNRSTSSSSSQSSHSQRSNSSERSKSLPRNPDLDNESNLVNGPRSPSVDDKASQSPPHLSDDSSKMPFAPNEIESRDLSNSLGKMEVTASSEIPDGQYLMHNEKVIQSPDSYDSPDFRPKSPGKPEDSKLSQPSSPSDKNSLQSSPVRSPTVMQTDGNRRHHTKAERKMVMQIKNRSCSESSQSSRGSTYRSSDRKDPATEAISDGEMESDGDDRKPGGKSSSSLQNTKQDANISHGDLSDVSDSDSVRSEEDTIIKQDIPIVQSESKENIKVNGNSESMTSESLDDKRDKVLQEKSSNIEDGEEQLDFEAEEGECENEPQPKDQSNGNIEKFDNHQETKAGKRSRGSSLEEGEVSDDGERRPEESEPRPVCRFFSRGACTWGVSCRFLHPGVTDKGNYSMFDVVRGVPPGGSYPPPMRDAPPESAWERGLRTAKEMLRIANKRKEQDAEFEEKKLHLSVGGAAHDPDAELAYAAAAVGASPPPAPLPPHPQHPPHALLPPHHPAHEPFRPFGPGPMFRGRMIRPPFEEREHFFERERGPFERERMHERPPYFEERPPEFEDHYHKKRVRPSREVIVQRAEVESAPRREGREARLREGREIRDGREVRELKEGREGKEGRVEDWADPWMRTETAARRRRPPSSKDSYSSSSSQSSRSASARRRRKESSSSRHRLSPTMIVRERRLATARATAMNPPAPRRRAPSPPAARLALAANPPAPHNKDAIDPYGRNKSRNRNRKRYSRSSSSGSESSSSSSGSESASGSSSSSGSSGARRARNARLLNAAARPRLNVKSGLAAAISTAASKKEVANEKDVSRKRTATSPPGGAAKKTVSRREELLKQLKAVEDAIARKRSKI